PESDASHCTTTDEEQNVDRGRMSQAEEELNRCAHFCAHYLLLLSATERYASRANRGSTSYTADFWPEITSGLPVIREVRSRGRLRDTSRLHRTNWSHAGKMPLHRRLLHS